MRQTEPLPSDAPEHVRARWWRENVVRLSRRQLAERIGLSQSAIADFELGTRRDGREISAESWLRYRLSCAALTAGLAFDWTSLRLEPRGRVTITVDGG